MSDSNSNIEDLDFCDTDNSFKMTLPGGDAVLCAPSSSDLAGSSVTMALAEPGVLLQQKDVELDAKDNEGQLIVIDSLIPMLQLLPGLFSDESLYYIHGTIEENDRARVYAYAAQVGDLTFSDNVRDGEASISPGVFLRLAQLQIPDRPLFPSLKRLRIIDANSSLDYLPLFLSPSLQILEVFGVSEDRRASFLSFIKTAVDSAPHLVSLFLGRGHIMRDALEICLGFTRLERLELANATASLDFQLLRDISCLERLTHLLIDNGFATYVPSDAVKEAEQYVTQHRGEEILRRKKLPEVSPPSPTSKTTGGTKTHRGNSFGYSSLSCSVCKQSFSTSGGQDVCPKCCEKKDRRRREKEEEERIRVALEHEGFNRHWYKVALSRQQRRSPGPQGDDMGFNTLSTLSVRGPATMMQDIVEILYSNSLSDITLELSDPPGSINSAIPASRRFIASMDFIMQHWAETIKRVTLLVKDPVSPLTLPKDTVDNIIRLPFLKYLDINGWCVDSKIVSHFINWDSQKPFKFQHLQLPDNISSPGLPLSGLRSIVEASPELVSLRCRLKNLTEVPIYSVPAPAPLSHKLKVLTVGNSTPSSDPQNVLEIARYLNVLFPDLEKIATLDSVEQNTEQWRYIGSLVKMFQTIRLDEKNRPSV